MPEIPRGTIVALADKHDRSSNTLRVLISRRRRVLGVVIRRRSPPANLTPAQLADYRTYLYNGFRRDEALRKIGVGA